MARIMRAIVAMDAEGRTAKDFSAGQGLQRHAKRTKPGMRIGLAETVSARRQRTYPCAAPSRHCRAVGASAILYAGHFRRSRRWRSYKSTSSPLPHGAGRLPPGAPPALELATGIGKIFVGDRLVARRRLPWPMKARCRPGGGIPPWRFSGCRIRPGATPFAAMADAHDRVADGSGATANNANSATEEEKDDLLTSSGLRARVSPIPAMAFPSLSCRAPCRISALSC